MSSQARPLLICVVGPTAIGKTSLGIRLAQKLGAEILSADSRQIHRSMSIGTAAPTALEREQAPHHFVEFLEPSEVYSAGDFEKDALAFLDTYFKSHPVAILVGGSGLYVKGVIKGFDFLPADLELREKLNSRAELEGVAVLAEELRALDPVHHAKMDLSNPQRVVRALEVCLCSGKPFSSFHSNEGKSRPFDIVQVGLKADREVLSSRIEERTAKMMETGWLEEVKKLMEYKDCNSLRTVGFRELISHLEGKMSLEKTVERIVISTRQFAKRQMTWFKKDESIRWYDFKEADKAFEETIKLAEEKIAENSGDVG